MSAFLNHSNDELRSAASFALGNMAISNLSVWAPRITQALQTETVLSVKVQYLEAIRELLIRYKAGDYPASQILPYTESLITLMITNSDSNEQGVRSICGEILGLCVSFSLANHMKHLKKLFVSNNSAHRLTALASLRHISADPVNNAIIAREFLDIFSSISHDNPVVVRSAAVSLITMIKTRRDVVAQHAAVMIDMTRTASRLRPELIEILEVGPIKHKVDKGADARKVCIEATYALIMAYKSLWTECGREVIDRMTNALSDENGECLTTTCAMFEDIAREIVSAQTPWTRIALVNISRSMCMLCVLY